MKIIKRVYIDAIDEKVDLQKKGDFIAKGVWADGRIIYSRVCADNANEGMFYQVRSKKYRKLIMIRE